MKLKNIIDGEKYFVKKSAEKISVPIEYCERVAIISKSKWGGNSHIAHYDDGDFWLVGHSELRKLREGEK